MHFELGNRRVFVAFHPHQIARRQFADQLIERRRGRFVQQRPAPFRRHDHLRRSGLAMAPAVLAGLVEVNSVVRLLDHRNLQVIRHAVRDKFLQQRGFARPAPACESKNGFVYHCNRVE